MTNNFGKGLLKPIKKRRALNIKGRKLGVLAVTVFCLMCLFAAAAKGASAWYQCPVNTAGLRDSLTFIKLDHTADSPAFTDKWFIASTERAKEVLAVALTSMT
ncbi:MAG: hypothetical protein GY847_07475 [Proteobacteria bacterium]|nr:hypothetical protein [Pseudomonadota bacterium]